MTLEPAKQNQIRIHQERLILEEQGNSRRCGFNFTDGGLEWIGKDQFLDDSEWTSEIDASALLPDDKLEDPRFFRGRDDRLLLSAIGTQPFVDLAEKLRASCIYNFSPSAMRMHQPITASPILVRDGSNLARAIEGLREIEPETIQRIGKYLSAIVEGVDDFQTVLYGDYETVQFRVTSVNGKPPVSFDASSMSDGTLRVLAALVAAYQIVLPGGFSSCRLAAARVEFGALGAAQPSKTSDCLMCCTS